MPLIHDSAVVSSNASLGPDVTVGPFAVIEDNVEIGSGTVIGPHAVIRRYTRMGENNTVDAGAVIGGLPQHLAFDGSETWVVIGNDNTFREGVTINRAYEPGATTEVGSKCYFMTASHVGHDCHVGDSVILTNGVVLGGHATVGRNAVLGGYAAVHQFVNVGAFCMVAACVALRKDALPYTMIGGTPVRHYRLNTVGLRRNGITGERYRHLERAFRALRNGNRNLTDLPDTDEIEALRHALDKRSKYGVYGFARGGKVGRD
jgi:UDP-N-acetylglucosamine acyltransferase